MGPGDIVSTAGSSTVPGNALASLVLTFAVLFGEVTAVRLNEIQILGTHNSFKVSPNPDLNIVRTVDPRLGFVLDANQYSHPSLQEQLEDFNVRCFEFDVFDDQPGGKFVPRGVRAVLGLDELFDDSPEMQGEGFKVLHIDNIDYETHCKTLPACLAVLKEWSDDNPSHIPLILRVELKLETMIESLERADPQGAGRLSAELQASAQTIDGMPVEYPRTDPPISAQTASVLLTELETILTREKLITPDDLRGEFGSLREALSALGPQQFWPDIDTVRGKMLLIVAGVGGELVQLYGSSLAQSPAFTRYFLEPFVNAPTLDIPADVIFVEHRAAGTSAYLEPLLSEGFFVITNADLAGQQARNNDFSSYDEVVAAGAQVILTEFLQPGPTDYFAELPCNGAAYCVLPSNSTAPPREPPVHEEPDDSGITSLKAVPELVEPQFPEGFDTGRSYRAHFGCMLLALLAIAVLL